MEASEGSSIGDDWELVSLCTSAEVLQAGLLDATPLLSLSLRSWRKRAWLQASPAVPPAARLGTDQRCGSVTTCNHYNSRTMGRRLWAAAPRHRRQR